MFPRRNVTRPRVDVYEVKVRAADPRAIGMARALGALLARGIDGHAGAVRYGYPAPGTRQKFAGYVDPPQLFYGYDPKKVAAGTFRGQGNRLPSTTSAAAAAMSPMQSAMATVTANQMGQAL